MSHACNPENINMNQQIISWMYNEKQRQRWQDCKESESSRFSLTCHPLGITYPPYSISFKAILKPPKIGGSLLWVSITTLHVHFILARFLHVRDSPLSLPFAITSYSEKSNKQASFVLLRFSLRYPLNNLMVKLQNNLLTFACLEIMSTKKNDQNPFQ